MYFIYNGLQEIICDKLGGFCDKLGGFCDKLGGFCDKLGETMPCRPLSVDNFLNILII